MDIATRSVCVLEKTENVQLLAVDMVLQADSE